MVAPDLYARLGHLAAADPTGTALVDRQGSLGYRELFDSVERLAAEVGARYPDRRRWGLRTGNDARSVVALLALGRAGHSPVLLDPKATEAETASVARLARLDGVLDTETLSPGAAGTVAAHPTPFGSPFGMVTSGTNGRPKVVRRSWANTAAVSWSFAEQAGYRAGDVVLCTTPIHHSYAFGIALTAGLLTGATVVLAPLPPRPNDLAALVADLRPAVFQSVPFLYRMLLEQGLPGGSAPRMCVTAGERLDRQTADAWRAATGAGLCNHYGTTENSVLTLADPDDLVSVGRPIPGVRIKVVGRNGRAATTGEILVRSPGRHSTYWGQPALTRESFTRGWQRTGDWGRLLPDGRLVITGRISQRISVAGRKVDPVEVDNVLRGHPAVRDCLVTGPPRGSEENGFFAFVAAEGVSELDLRRHLARRLSSYKVPTRLVLLPSLPRTGSRKVHIARLWQDLGIL